MSYALGQPVPLRALVRDAAGVLDDATTVALTITLPDGTTATPTVVNPPAVTGTYVYDYAPTLPGLHSVRWVFAGTNASAPAVDAFHVDPIALPPLASLAEARQQCRIGTTDDDALLQRMLMTASSHCERRTQLWRRQALTATKDGGSSLVRLRHPVISVTSVTESGVTVASDGYVLDAEAGQLFRGTMTAPLRWACGVQNVAVTYVGGTADGVVPDEIRQGVLLLTQHVWDTQRGGSNLPRNAGTDFAMPVGFTIPNAVLEQWSSWIPELIA